MGKPTRTHILRMVSIVIALAMIVPGVILTQQFMAAPVETQVDARSGTVAWVNFESPAQAGMLKDIGASIVSLRENGAYISMTDSQRGFYSEKFDIVELTDRTVVDLAEQGITFDSKVGYDLPAEWRNPNSNEYLVQFVAPTETAWNDGVRASSGKILREIGDKLVVVKMTEAQKAKVENLGYVQWVGVYEPGFKMDRNIPSTGTVKVTVEAYDKADIPMIIETMKGFGATPGQDEEFDNNFGGASCYIDASALPTIAKMDSVKLVWNLQEMKTLVNVGGRIAQAHDLWVQTVSNLPSQIAGQGQIVHVQDTGIDATHRDFLQGPLGDRLENPDSTTDPDYHGTHCAGIVGGNGFNMETWLGLSTANRVYNELAATNPAGRPDRMGFAGRAPECTIYMRAGLVSNEWANGYTFGARIFSNSWGPALMSNTYDATGDNFMLANAGALIIFAAGNDGPRTNTVSGIGNGKMTLQVGAVENMRPVDFDSSDDYNQMASFSSRGPVADGRIKPDICEYGTAVYATKSDDATEAVAPGLYDTNYPINADADAAYDYISLQGTSMACPAVAGDAALVRDYLVDVQGITAPHANLIKTLLIHGAEDMGLGYPSYDQGWGRVNVRNSIIPAFPNVLQWYHSDAGIGSGTWSAATDGGMNLQVIDNTVPLKVTMTHWDSAGSGELTYDLDLVVTSPTGVRYEGNAFKEAWSTPCTGASQWGGTFTQFPTWVGGNSYDFDEDDDGGDDENNVEIFRVQYPEKGIWNVQVVWRSSTARPFTVAVTGGFAAQYDVNIANYDYRVNMGLDVPRLVPERDDFGEATFKGAQDGSLIVPYWINNGDTTDDTYTMSAPLLPTGFTIAYTPTSPVTVNAGKRVHGYARIMIGGSVAAGTHVLAIRATSNSDTTAPIAQSQIKFNVDVVTAETPPTIKVASTAAHEAAPAFTSWGTNNVNIGLAYIQDTQFGVRVMFKKSPDGGATWDSPIVVSPASWGPGYVGITYMPTGTYAGRIMIAYNAWNPDGVGGNTGDTRCSYIKVAYADSPYTSWTTNVNAFTLGEGRSTGNTYRATNVIADPTRNAFMLVVEVFGYDGTDLNTANMNDISCAYKVSTNGGGTWSAIGYVDTNGLNLYYFFPNVDRLPNGNIFVYFYERDAADAAQDRDASFREYNGAWGTYYVSWDTTDNLMMPQALATNEGTGGNRRYGFYLKGANTDGDRQMYMHYSDTGTTWQTNGGAGWQMSSTIMSDHDYGTRFVFSTATSNSVEYIFGHRNVRYDPYGQPNMLAIYGADLITARTEAYMTLDSFVHGKQDAVATYHDAAHKVFVAQNTMNVDTSRWAIGHDIVGMHVYPNWASAPDTWGPVTEYLSADKTICNQGDIVTVVANVQDWTTGGSLVSGARYRVDGGTAVAMQSYDGAFNAESEAVISTTTPINTASLSPGWHTIEVQGQDSAGYWGAWVSIQIYVNPPVVPYATAQGPTGTSNDQTPTVAYIFDNSPTTITVYYTTNGGTSWSAGVADATIDGTYTFGTLAAGTYHWNVRANGEAAPSGAASIEAGPYVIDLTPPNAPSGLTVHQYGMVDATGTTTYTFAGVTQATNDHFAYFLDADDQSEAELTTPNSATEFTNTDYTNIVTSDNVYAQAADPGLNDERHIRYEYAIAENPANIISINVTHEGYWDNAQTITLYALHDDMSWDAIGTTQAFGDLVEGTMTRTITPAADYINAAGKLTVIFASTQRCNNGVFVDYASAEVFYSSTAPGTDDNTMNWTASTSPDLDHYNIYRSDLQAGTYTLIGTAPAGTNTYEDDLHGTADGTLWWYRVRAVDAAGNEETNTNAVQEPGMPVFEPYDISLAGRTAGQWVFISFPSAMSGNIQTILNDATAGDGLTTWSVAKWYNGQTKVWTSYRATGTQTLTTISNQMGVWLLLTANGGDQVLTLSSYAANPAAAVNINLYTGWNMVGYPSATNRLASATLPAEADQVAVWSGTTPYITDSAPGSVTMSHGNAYWVRVTADCTWIVNP